MSKYTREMECVECGTMRTVRTTSEYRYRAVCLECDNLMTFEKP